MFHFGTDWKLLTWWDFFLAPIYIYLFYKIWKAYVDKHYSDNIEMHAILMRAFKFKIYATLFIALVYEFYYYGGDVEGYLTGASNINAAFFYKPSIALRMIFTSAEEYKEMYLNYYFNKELLHFIGTKHFLSTAELTVIKIGAFFSLITFCSYLPLTLVFSLIAFYGSFKVFSILAAEYPDLKSKFAFAFFYTPSILVWSSGLLKDPITYAGVSMVFYCTYRIIVHRKINIKYILGILFFGFVVLKIKSYILISMIPAILLFIFIGRLSKIRYTTVYYIALPFIIIIVGSLSFVFFNTLQKELGKYSLENVTYTANAFQSWHTIEGQMDNGSIYSLGEMDFTTFGLLKKIPLAFNVTYFRPYFWESRKPFVILASLESMYFIVITYQMFRKVKLSKFFGIISKTPILVFSITFFTLFGIGVGLTSYNFGALMRYKIPSIPYYLVFIYLATYLGTKSNVKDVEVKS